jgi:flagellin-like hook-associated protein FlgL
MTNMAAIDTHRSLKNSSLKSTVAAERLSSGLKINRAADDSAGLAISEKMRSQIRGLDRAENNIQDGTSLLQVADGALQEAQNIVQRMRELAVQACNDTNTYSDRLNLDKEYEQLCFELDNIAQNTEFNTRKLFTGEYAKKIFTGLEVSWENLIEDDSLNCTTYTVPTLIKDTSYYWLGNQYPPSITNTIPAFPSVSSTPKAVLNTTPRPARDLPGDANDLTGDVTYDESMGTVDNIGGKIIAGNGIGTLDVGENTSYKGNIDGSWTKWQGQRRDYVVVIPAELDSNGNEVPGTEVKQWTAWYDDVTLTVGTIEDHSENSLNGGTAGAPLPRTNAGNTEYRWDRIIDQFQPTTKYPTGTTDYDYEHDEWERSDIFSEAEKTNVASNNGGVVFVQNSTGNSETNIGSSARNGNYHLSSETVASPPHALVDTNTRLVTVNSNGVDAWVISRNIDADSTYNTENNKGTIYSSAEKTTIGINEVTYDALENKIGTIYVNSNKSANSETEITINNGELTTNTRTVNVLGKTDVTYDNTGTIIQLNYDDDSSFSLNGSNGGTIKTQAEEVTITGNNYGTLYTKREWDDPTAYPPDQYREQKLTITGSNSYPGVIRTTANDISIGANNGELNIENSDAVAVINSTGVYSNIDTKAKDLTINDDANGQLRIESGAAVTIKGNNNAIVQIAPKTAGSPDDIPGGKLTVEKDLSGTIFVQTGATLEVKGNITGALYIQEGANVTLKNPLTGSGKIIFLGEPATFSPAPPLNVPTGMTVELHGTSSIGIGTNSGTVNMFDTVNSTGTTVASTATIANNQGVLTVNENSEATVNANSGTITNFAKVIPDPASIQNTGTIDNWGTIEPRFINDAANGGTINHNLPFATDDKEYDTSLVKFPSIDTTGSLDPPVQEATITITQNDEVYTLKAQWQATATKTDPVLPDMCDCPIGPHNRNECTDTMLALIADAFELKFDITTIDPALPEGEKFTFLPDPSLNSDDGIPNGMRYDIDGNFIIYNVDQYANVREIWENGKGLWLQTGANTEQGHNVYLPKLEEGMDEAEIGCVFCDCDKLMSGDLTILQNAIGTLELCDFAIGQISDVRSYVGAQINRLAYTGNSVAISHLNQSASESRIRDADMAKEMMALTKGNILTQAGISLLAQANQSPQQILSLLNG